MNGYSVTLTVEVMLDVMAEDEEDAKAKAREAAWVQFNRSQMTIVDCVDVTTLWEDEEE